MFGQLFSRRGAAQQGDVQAGGALLLAAWVWERSRKGRQAGGSGSAPLHTSSGCRGAAPRAAGWLLQVTAGIMALPPSLPVVTPPPPPSTPPRPPAASWRYDYQPEAQSTEAKFLDAVKNAHKQRWV